MKWERISTKHNRPILSICPPRKDERYGLILQVGLPVQLVGVVVVLPSEAEQSSAEQSSRAEQSRQ